MLRVPAEFPEVQQAIDAALLGDLVLVEAGEYVIREPINFRGKAITLQSAMGPRTTVLRMAENPLDPGRASVVIFENHETFETVLEGFTLTGGKGTSTVGDGALNALESRGHRPAATRSPNAGGRLTPAPPARVSAS